MKVVVVHYHFKSGGVTSVIRRHLEACLRAGIEAFLLTGEEPPDSPGVPWETVPGLAYDPPGRRESPDTVLGRGAALARDLAAAAGRLSGGGPVLYHVHNPTIRKNAALCPALDILARTGARILIQAHDFAEDWRPDMLQHGLPYPAGCRWAVLNGRDYRALRDAGLSEADIDLLPNPLPSRAASVPPASASRADLVLYPVRGIPRKNLGELLLLSRWLPPDLSAAVTLPPNNPRDRPIHEAWKSLARETGARVFFDAGLSSSLDDLYARTRTVVTTSVKEGFGFSFLEPLARGVPVAGRRLASVLPDFEAAGISYPGLYSALRVPEGLFNREAFETRLYAVLESVSRAVAAALGHRPSWLAERMDRVRQAALPPEGPDFGVLDAEAQAEALERVFRDPDAPSSFEARNPFLRSWWEVPPPDGSEALEEYSPARCGDRLVEAYERTVASVGSGSTPDRAALLRALLVPEGFFCPGL
ncbi:MAG: glycosyltransferase family 4 protein [Treponema sp.]|nr:glycosyltransferase family 4 protein [Treponema sp.]